MLTFKPSELLWSVIYPKVDCKNSKAAYLACGIWVLPLSAAQGVILSPGVVPLKSIGLDIVYLFIKLICPTSHYPKQLWHKTQRVKYQAFWSISIYNSHYHYRYSPLSTTFNGGLLSWLPIFFLYLAWIRTSYSYFTCNMKGRLPLWNTVSINRSNSNIKFCRTFITGRSCQN